MTEMKDEFLNAINSDLGKCANASGTEIALTVAAAQHDLKHLSTYMKDIHEETELLLAPATTMIRYEPFGVVAIFSAWNYPIMTALKPLVQCITTGNCAIVKPSEIAAATSSAIKKFIDRYLDPDCIRCIEGGIDVAVKLNEQKLDLICFTGSTYVGKIIAGVAAKNLTPCILELGGKCPTIIHPTCDLEFVADIISWGRFSNSGQTCIAPDYLFVHESILERFNQILIETVKRQWGEDP